MFSVHPYLGKIPILTNSFQMGWFNYQPINIFSQHFSQVYPPHRMPPCHHGWEGHHRDLTDRGEFPHLLGQRHRDRGFSGKGNHQKTRRKVGPKSPVTHRIHRTGIFTHHESLICVGFHVGKYIVRPMEILWVVNFGARNFLITPPFFGGVIKYNSRQTHFCSTICIGVTLHPGWYHHHPPGW